MPCVTDPEDTTTSEMALGGAAIAATATAPLASRPSHRAVLGRYRSEIRTWVKIHQ